MSVNAMKSAYRLYTATAYLVVLLIVAILFVLLLLDRLWREKVISYTYNAKANIEEETVGEILERLYGTNTLREFKWRVSTGDFPYLEANVYCTGQSDNSGSSSVMFVWQWDISWPSVRAVTPLGARVFPSLNPKCPLTEDGRTRLQSGRKSITNYFNIE